MEQAIHVNFIPATEQANERNFIDLTGDDKETTGGNEEDEKPNVVLGTVPRKESSALRGPCSLATRQFWKAGDYEPRKAQAPVSVSQNGQSRLRVHPKFLHSNATSHKWAFGAIAELLDNAVDEVHNGATFVAVDKIMNPQNGNPALLIQDDGGGMDPESLRRCMSFGFSDKQSNCHIGQYGNGFKTSTMRLGADVIVFTRRMIKRTLTQSVGLLSYTFLRQSGYDDIVVPMVDYKFDQSAGVFERLLPHGQKRFSSNLVTLLKWSPFDTEVKLLEHFNDIGYHGTKIIIFNLWLNDEGDMELDFNSNNEDIMISGAPKPIQTNSIPKMLTQKHIANQLRYSLRVYSSVLYLHLPENFRIILRGQAVEPHKIVKDLKYCECIVYKPQDGGGRREAEVVTTIGFVEGAPVIDIHGFNIYHKNRLILPFWKVVTVGNSKGKGVVGVLEANFIKPTHDKQDFEKSTLTKKLESRLKEMTNEYWVHHCQLVGYNTNHRPPRPGCYSQPVTVNPGTSQGPICDPPNMPACTQFRTVRHAPTQEEEFISVCDSHSRAGKRKYKSCNPITEQLKRQEVVDGGSAAGPGIIHKTQTENFDEHRRVQDIKTMTQRNRSLRAECLEYEKKEATLMLKVRKLQLELEGVQQSHDKLLEELKLMDEVKVEKL